jgi:hypothetical protein
MSSALICFINEALSTQAISRQEAGRNVAWNTFLALFAKQRYRCRRVESYLLEPGFIYARTIAKRARDFQVSTVLHFHDFTFRLVALISSQSVSEYTTG